jgi:hypothetical protein
MVKSVSPEDTVVYEFLVDDQIYDLGDGKREKIKNQDNPGFEGDRHCLKNRIAKTIADTAQGVYTGSITGIIKSK